MLEPHLMLEKGTSVVFRYGSTGCCGAWAHRRPQIGQPRWLIRTSRALNDLGDQLQLNAPLRTHQPLARGRPAVRTLR